MSDPLFTIGDGTDRQMSVFRSRDGYLSFEFWDTDVSNACVDYDWESSRVFLEKDEEDKLFQELLKKQDRSALLWALLEEMAGEVVVEDAVTDCGYRYKRFFFGGISWCKLYAEGGLVKAPRNPVEGEGVLAFSACLARAIQEQRKREAGAQDA